MAKINPYYSDGVYEPQYREIDALQSFLCLLKNRHMYLPISATVQESVLIMDEWKVQALIDRVERALGQLLGELEEGGKRISEEERERIDELLGDMFETGDVSEW